MHFSRSLARNNTFYCVVIPFVFWTSLWSHGRLETAEIMRVSDPSFLNSVITAAPSVGPAGPHPTLTHCLSPACARPALYPLCSRAPGLPQYSVQKDKGESGWPGLVSCRRNSRWGASRVLLPRFYLQEMRQTRHHHLCRCL